MPKATIYLMVLGVLLGGCATTEVQRLAKANDEHVYALFTNKQGVELVMRDCPVSPVIEGNAAVGWQSPPCVDVAGTRDPNDTEFWKFQLYHVDQVRIGPYGIPLIPVSPRFKSGQSTKIGVVGPREKCEAIRLPLDRKPPGVAGDDAMHMTDPCDGPFYFRRPEVAR
jgi:hypothetical protein